MKNLLIKTFFIFLLFTVIFSLIQFSSQNLAGADSYYHIKHGYIYQMEGLSQNFPWLQNNFSNGYSDPYFLYHILLIPFTFGNLIFGAKLAAILFVSFIFTLFYWILKQYKIKSAFLLTILLFCASNVFIFRMALARPHLLSLLFLLAGFYLISKKKYFWLFILSIIYALSYEVSILIIFIAFIYFISEYIFKRKFDLKLLLCPASGILIGYFIHPNSLEYLYATYLVIFKIPFLEKSIFDLGIEISPITDFSAFASSNLIVLILFAGGFISCIINLSNDIAPRRFRATYRWFRVVLRTIKHLPRNISCGLCKNLEPATSIPEIPLIPFTKGELKNDKKIILYSLFLISVFFFILTLKANRFVEYWVPFTILFGAFGINLLIHTNLSRICANFFLKRAYIIKFFTAIMLLGLVIANISYASFGIKSGMEYDKYKSAAEWLNKNTPQGSIIFHTSW
jgi:hypothetical protein